MLNMINNLINKKEFVSNRLQILFNIINLPKNDLLTTGAVFINLSIYSDEKL